MLFSLVLSMLFLCLCSLHYVVLFCSLCSILFGFVTFSVSLYTLYSLGFFLLSLSLSQCSLYLFSILYTLWFFGCHYFFSVFSIRYTLWFTSEKLAPSLFEVKVSLISLDPVDSEFSFTDHTQIAEVVSFFE